MGVWNLYRERREALAIAREYAVTLRLLAQAAHPVNLTVPEIKKLDHAVAGARNAWGRQMAECDRITGLIRDTPVDRLTRSEFYAPPVRNYAGADLQPESSMQ